MNVEGLELSRHHEHLVFGRVHRGQVTISLGVAGEPLWHFWLRLEGLSLQL